MTDESKTATPVIAFSTRPLRTSTMTILGLWSYYDLNHGSRYLATAFGLRSALWTMIWAIAAWTLAQMLCSALALRMYLYRTISVYKAESVDALGASLFDLPFWSATVALALAVVIFVQIAPGRLSFARVVGVLASTAIAGSILAGKLAFSVSKALHGPSRVRKAITRRQCEWRYLPKRCDNWMFHGGPACRWHFIGAKTAHRFGHSQRWASLFQRLGAFGLALAAASVMAFIRTHQLVWAVVAAVAFGVALRLIADGIIIPYAVLSQLTGWMKMFAWGVVLQTAGAGAIMAAALVRPNLLQPILDRIPGAGPWGEFGTALVYAAAAIVALEGGHALVSRVLFFDMGGAAAFAPIAFMPLLLILQEPIRRWSEDARWSQILEHDPVKVLGLTYLLGFSLAGARKRAKGRPRTLDALGGSVRTIVTLLALMTSRYLMLWASIRSTTYFVIASAVLSMLFGLIAGSIKNRLKA